ncbi:MAG: CBS domain-containing protein [archaeon]|nr:CBS domain-containing protein [archaeon]
MLLEDINMDLKEVKAKDVMVTDLVTVSPSEKIGAVDLKMIRASIGGVPVVNDSNKLLGIMTQRDIMLSRFTATITNSKVEDLMTRDVITCNLDTSFKDILKKMLENNIERLPVVDNDKTLKGLIVHKNIINEIYNAMENNSH